MKEIREFEAMAMLDLPDDERSLLTERFNELTGGFDALGRIGTDGAEPLITVLDLYNVLRDDVSEKLLTRFELLANAPEQYDGFFKVPGTLE